MSINKVIRNNFNAIWEQYCTSEPAGYKVLDKDAFSSDINVPIIWGSCERIGTIKILVVLYPNKMGSFIPLIFIDVDRENRIAYPRKKFPTRLSNRLNNIGKFSFSRNELKELFISSNLEPILSKKIEDIDKFSFDRIYISLLRRKRQTSKPQPRSVYTISAGLYGLGKNRKH